MRKIVRENDEELRDNQEEEGCRGGRNSGKSEITKFELTRFNSMNNVFLRRTKAGGIHQVNAAHIVAATQC